MEAILLGFDYGNKKIGVAVGQSLTGAARPLKTVVVKDNKPDWREISRIIDTWQPAALVVGLPLTMEGGEQDMTKAARRFGRQLRGRYHLPVHTMDERLSSNAAGRLQREKGGNMRKLDPVAAQLILETWLAENEDL